VSLSGAPRESILTFRIDEEGKPIRRYTVDPASPLGRLMFAEAARQDAPKYAAEISAGGTLEG
jgi:hypothetical protein